MSVAREDSEKVDRLAHADPGVSIFLRPIAPPAPWSRRLCGITASWIARWWGNEESPGIFPFVAFWGGLAQFLAGLKGYPARDTLITVINVLWDSFWMSAGLLCLLVRRTDVFTWSGALASAARDLVLCGVMTTLAIGSTIACCLFAYGPGVSTGMYVAAYFWIVSAILAWWRVTVYLVEEAYGQAFMRYFPVFRTSTEKRKPLVVPGFGEPGVRRGMPGIV
ncbi:hypothetical protein MFIFM68171_06666 [Madurella fahalii]|uniref:Uncharacterized protein n=1 Tax=Madurella fahalii TaxID=1157608 RepID=A0ABQ0GFA4_9PEZI